MLAPFSARGKIWEPKALGLRALLGIPLAVNLDPWRLAGKVGLVVIDGHQALKCLPREDRTHLVGPGRGRWSGGVYPEALPDGRFICILNPQHSRRRNRITLMEEICHIHLGHSPSSITRDDGGVLVRGYDRDQEGEAYGVGAACLLPWEILFAEVNSGRTIEDLANDFELSEQLVTYRIKTAGAYALYSSRQRKSA